MARRFGLVELFVLVLALASVAVVAVQMTAHPDRVLERRLQWAEYALIAMFALEFTLALLRHDHPVTYALRNWYELLALVPVVSGPATALPFFPVLRVVVLLARFGRVVDRLYGDEAFYRMVDRVRDVAVEWVADAVTVRVLDQTLAVLEKAAFTRNLAQALDEHGAEIEETVVEKVKHDPAFRRLAAVPFMDDLAAFTGSIARRIAIETLRDPRTERLVHDVIRANVKQIRDEVRRLDTLAKPAA